MAGFIKVLKTNVCLTDGTYGNANGIYQSSPGFNPPWDNSGNDYYTRATDTFSLPAFLANFTDVGKFVFPFSAIGSDWQTVLDIDAIDEEDQPSFNIKFYFRNTGVYMYARLVIYDIQSQTQIYDSGQQVGIPSNVYGNCAGALAIYKDSNNFLGIGYVYEASNIAGFMDYSPWCISFFVNAYKLARTYNLPSVPFEFVEKSDEYGEASTTGGYSGGTFDDSSDQIDVPTMPAAGVSSAGFINVYNPSFGQLQQFGAELFPNLSFTPVSSGGTPAGVTEALEAIAQIFVDFGNQIPALIDMYINSNLIQYVIDCHIIPVAPTTGAAGNVKVGFKTFTPAPAKVTSDYVDFDCGSLNVGEYYANFADYAPYTRAKLYLPFVGFVDIQPEYWQSGTLQVKYRFNVIDGSFVAFVISTSSKSNLSQSVVGQYGGNACVHIPITGLNYANMVSGIVSAASGLLPTSGSGAGIADKLVNSANTIAAAKPSMQQSNGYNATTSFLTVRTPYLLIERSVSNFSTSYDRENGIPSNVTFNFSELTGLTKATMLHLDGIEGATEADLDEIAELLAEGVIL